jgi:hypothetical protein
MLDRTAPSRVPATSRWDISEKQNASRLMKIASAGLTNREGADPPMTGSRCRLVLRLQKIRKRRVKLESKTKTATLWVAVSVDLMVVPERLERPTLRFVVFQCGVGHTWCIHDDIYNTFFFNTCYL